MTTTYDEIGAAGRANWMRSNWPPASGHREPIAEGKNMFHNRQPSDDALLDAIEAAHIAKREEEIRLDREYEHPIDVSDLPPNSVARPGVPIAVRQRELDDIVEWLDGLIAKLPDGDEED